MDGYTISLQDNEIRVGLFGDVDSVVSKKVGKEVVDGCRIVDSARFAEELGNLIVDEFGPNPKKVPLHFLVGPADVVLGFITLSKKNADDESFFIAEISKKLKDHGISIGSVYYSHQKIAPFVCQFVAVEKKILEKYIEVANLLEFELKSVISWPLLLPKIVSNSGNAAIFILNMGKSRVLALSELGGIYHLGVLNEEKGPSDIQNMVRQLSVYQRSEPIKDIYTLMMGKLDLGEEHNISELSASDPGEVFYNAGDPLEILTTQINLLNLLPLPVEAKKKPVAVYAGAISALAIVLIGVFWTLRVSKTNKSQIEENVVAEVDNEIVVLGEVSEASETETVEESDSEGPEEIDLKREYLKVRVENGAGIAGLAGKTSGYLEELRYEVVSVGDAPEWERTMTVARFNTANILYKDLLLGDLSKRFDAIDFDESLEDGLGYDVLIIVGSNEKLKEE